MAGVIGDPIAHSLSPMMHNAAFRALDLNWVFVAFAVRSGRAPAVLEAMRAMGIDGLSVTMPHKDAVYEGVDELDADAVRLRAVNCVERRGDVLIGHNTDGPGFIAALREKGCDPKDKRCLVFGAGGAARAVILALHRGGASEVVVLNRTHERAVAAASLAGPLGSVGRLGDESTIGRAEIIVNATSIGMESISAQAAVESPCPPGLLDASHTVVDLVVNPVDTLFLGAAAQRGAKVIDGVGMLVHQAAFAFEFWTGLPAPVEVMEDAARKSLL